MKSIAIAITALASVAAAQPFYTPSGTYESLKTTTTQPATETSTDTWEPTKTNHTTTPCTTTTTTPCTTTTTPCTTTTTPCTTTTSCSSCEPTVTKPSCHNCPKPTETKTHCHDCQEPTKPGCPDKGDCENTGEQTPEKPCKSGCDTSSQDGGVKQCKPGTYQCAVNPKTGQCGWNVCDVSCKWVYGGDCQSGTVCKFNEANQSPYCVPPNFKFL